MTPRLAPRCRLAASVLAAAVPVMAAAEGCLPGPPFEPGPQPASSASGSAQPASPAVSGPGASPSATPPGSAQAPPPSPSSEGRGASLLLVVEPSGSLCSLDGATGQLRWRLSARATDAAWGPSGGLAAVEPAGQGGGDDPGRIVRYHEEPSGPAPLAELPFDGEAGRLLEAGEPLVGLLFHDGATLFSASASGGAGTSWVSGRSALALGTPEGHLVLSLDAEGALWSAWATAGQVDASPPSPLPFAAEALFERGGEAAAAVDGGLVQARTLSGALIVSGSLKVPEGAWVEEAAWDGAALWALLGPEPELRRLGEGGEEALALGDGSWWEQPLPSRRLWASRGRAYVASGERLFAARAGDEGLSLDPSFSPACEAASVTGKR